MTSTRSRYLALTGPGAALAFVVAFATSTVPPGVSAGGSATVRFYRAHATGAHVSDLMWALGLSLLVLFAGTLRSRLRAVPEAEGFASTALAGAAVTAAGGAVYFGCDFALGSMPASMSPSAAQAVNLLALQLFLPLAVGIFVFAIAVGVAILRAEVLPRWSGWVAIVMALTCLGAWLSLLVVGLWACVVGILLVRRPEATPRAPGAVEGQLQGSNR